MANWLRVYYMTLYEDYSEEGRDDTIVYYLGGELKKDGTFKSFRAQGSLGSNSPIKYLSIGNVLCKGQAKVNRAMHVDRLHQKLFGFTREELLTEMAWWRSGLNRCSPFYFPTNFFNRQGTEGWIVERVWTKAVLSSTLADIEEGQCSAYALGAVKEPHGHTRKPHAEECVCGEQWERFTVTDSIPTTSQKKLILKARRKNDKESQHVVKISMNWGNHAKEVNNTRQLIRENPNKWHRVVVPICGYYKQQISGNSRWFFQKRNTITAEIQPLSVTRGMYKGPREWDDLHGELNERLEELGWKHDDAAGRQLGLPLEVVNTDDEYAVYFDIDISKRCACQECPNGKAQEMFFAENGKFNLEMEKTTFPGCCENPRYKWENTKICRTCNDKYIKPHRCTGLIWNGFPGAMRV